MKRKHAILTILLTTALSFCLTSCSGATEADKSAAVSTDSFTVTPTKSKLIVDFTDGSTQELQTVLDKSIYDPTKLIVDDYNFDGYQDIAFPANYNTHNILYQLWLYNPESGSFEKYDSFSNYYGPTIDAENKQIKTFCQNDADSTSSGVYEWRDGELFCLELKTVTKDEDGKEIVTHLVYDEEAGQLVLQNDDAQDDSGDNEE